MAYRLRPVRHQVPREGSDPEPQEVLQADPHGPHRKENPRLGQDWLIWADADNIVKIIQNTYRFVEEHISPNAPAWKEHIGYIIDRVGFEEFKKYALDGVELMPETVMRPPVYWSGVHFDHK